MKFQPTAIKGVYIAETNLLNDHRGTFSRFYCNQDLAPVLGDRQIVQINHSFTKTTGVIRGMHYQHPPHAEMKFVRCINGRVWDVAVDLRADSSTFLKWHAVELDSQSARMMIIPEGCAHGFQVLEPDSEMLYLHTALFAPEMADGVPFDDPRLAITWPLAISELSRQGKQHPPMPLNFSGIKV